jgi:hypothetical protein
MGYTVLYSVVTLLFVYALVASIHASHTAKRGIARERAGIFALAFGLRDLIRWTIKQSTVAAVFIAVFYLVSEGADRLLSSEFGNIMGLFASALIVFFLVPLQRFAERVAGAAMPHTENTPEFAMLRKMQVFEAALAEAIEGELRTD